MTTGPEPLRAARPREAWRRERPPLLLTSFALFTVAVLTLPLVGLVLRAPWGDSLQRVRDPQVVDALRLSLVFSATATGLDLVLGVPLAWLLARTSIPARSLLRGIVLLPLLLPPLVTGVGLLTAFGRRGLVGRWLDTWFGVTLPFTGAGAVLAMTFIGLPFVVIMVEAALRSADIRYEDAATTLGASRLVALRTVTVPAIAPSLLGGAALAWARTLGEFGATVTFAGNRQGVTQTIPLAVFVSFEVDLDQAILLSLLLMLPTLAVLVIAVRGRFFQAP